MGRTVGFLLTLWLALALAAAAQPAKPLDLDGVLKLKRAGFSDDVLIAAVKSAEDLNFDTSPDGLLAMKAAGLSERVLLAILERQRATTVTAPAPTASVTLLAGEQELTLTSSTLMTAFGPKDAKFSEKVKESGGAVTTESEKAKAAKDAAHRSGAGSALSRVPWGRIASGGDPSYGKSGAKGEPRPIRARQFFYLEEKAEPEVSGRLIFRLPPKLGGMNLDDYEPVLYKLQVFEKERARVAETRDVQLMPARDPSSDAPPDIQRLAASHQEMRLELRRDPGGIMASTDAVSPGCYALLLKEIAGNDFAPQVFEVRVK